MVYPSPSRLLTLSALVGAAWANGATYTLSSRLNGEGFLDAFEWQAIPDPTHGRVNYVNETTAWRDGLVTVLGETVTLRADFWSVLSASGPGRNSFRIQSFEQYTTHVAIFDVAHMPQGCGTWPAIWCDSFSRWVPSRILTSSLPQEVGANWPNEGEVDIVEGVNDQSPNQSTLHTNANCTMPANRTMTGTSRSNNCDVYETNNGGCGVGINDIRSYGPYFNGIGGGWYAIERTPTYISIYFWERDSEDVPLEVVFPGYEIDTSTWGEPAAYFPSTDCDFATHFGPHNIVINLTFCGDWAGNSYVYAASGCPSTCVDYVDQNPLAFAGAFFTFNGLYIYE